MQATVSHITANTFSFSVRKAVLIAYWPCRVTIRARAKPEKIWMSRRKRGREGEEGTGKRKEGTYCYVYKEAKYSRRRWIAVEDAPLP